MCPPPALENFCYCFIEDDFYSFSILKMLLIPSNLNMMSSFSAALKFPRGSFFRAHSFLPFLSFHDTVSSSLLLTLLILSSISSRLMFILSGIFFLILKYAFSAQLLQFYCFNLFYFIILFWKRISSCSTD